MIEKLQKLYAGVLNKHKLQSEIEKAKETFEVKPFVSEYLPLKKFAVIGKPFFGLFSICTGFGLLFYKFAETLPFAVAVGLAVGLLVGLEIVKSELTNLTFKKAFQLGFKPVTLVFSFFLMACFAGSVFLSVNGAKDIYKHLDKSVTNLTGVHTNKQDSMIAYFDKQIASEKKALSEFKSSVTWQGKIDITNKATAKVIGSHTANLQSMANDKRNALQSLQIEQASSLTALHQDNSFNLDFWLYLSLTIEFLIVGCGGFVVWYQYKTVIESEIFTETKSYPIDLNGVQKLVEMITLNAGALPMINQLTNVSPNQTNHKVGFNFGSTNAPVTNPTNVPVTKVSNTPAPTDPLNAPVTSTNNAPVKMVHIGDEIECEHCQKKFIKKTLTHRFCSSQCRMDSAGYVPTKRRK